MKLSALLVCAVLPLLLASPAWAAVDPNTCAEKSKQVKRSERDAFIKSCMAQVNSAAKDANQQNKKALCEQNARNHKLEGSAKSNYISECLNRNEAAAAVAASPAKSQASAKPAKPKASAKVVKNKNSRTARSCAQQASKKGLKGDERKKFIATCKAG